MFNTLIEKIKLITNRFNLFNNFVSVFIILLLTFVSFSAGVMYADLTSGNFQKANNNTAGSVKQVAGQIENLVKPNEKDNVRGNKNAKIALIEYSDIDCPFCKQFHSTAIEILKQYEGEVMWVHRDFPIDSLHPEASKKAIAAACVSQLSGNDSYWKFIDILYERAEKASDLENIAIEIGVDKTKFNDCYTNSKTKSDVLQDYNDGIKAGVQGTPGNFVMNVETGKSLELRGAVPAEEVAQAIESVK